MTTLFWLRSATPFRHIPTVSTWVLPRHLSSPIEKYDLRLYFVVGGKSLVYNGLSGFDWWGGRGVVVLGKRGEEPVFSLDKVPFLGLG